jgi:hypothetical protein
MEIPQSFKHTAQAVSTRITLHSATAVRSFLARICQTQKPTKIKKKSEKPRQGLYNVGFIGGVRIRRSSDPQDQRTARKHPLRTTLVLMVNKRDFLTASRPLEEGIAAT